MADAVTIKKIRAKLASGDRLTREERSLTELAVELMREPEFELRDLNEPELRLYFSMLARMVESNLPPGPSHNGKCHFVLIVSDNSGIGQYVSNAERSGIIKLLRETADRLDQREDIYRE